MTGVDASELERVGRRVVVVGAGIAGLTAAHELVVRGFEVEVVESEVDYPTAPGTHARPAVGGMARSHIVAAPVADDRNPGPSMQKPPFSGLGRDRFPPATRVPLDDDPRDVIQAFATSYRAATADVASYPIQVQLLSSHKNESLRFVAPEKVAKDERLDAFKEVFEVVQTALASIDGLRLDCVVIPIRANEKKPDPDAMYVRVLYDALPAEHGFRFFPSFYRHLFDTMRRIPILEDSPEKSMVNKGARLTEDTSETLFDNLRPAKTFELALPREGGRARSHAIPRRAPESLEEAKGVLRYALVDAGYEGEDLARMQIAYTRYLLTSPERREAELETTSWASFLKLDRFSPRFREHVLSAAQALTAMSSRKNDARTIGNVALQLTLDQLRNEYVDGTLDGPTTYSMLEPWREFLEAQGVKFTLGQLVGFEKPSVGEPPLLATRPVFADVPADSATEPKFLEVDPADYYVITIPVDAFRGLFRRPALGDVALLSEAEMRDLAGRWAEVAGVQDDVSRYLKFAMNEHSSPSGAPDQDDVGVDAGPLRHMVGVQYFLDVDVRVQIGHTMCQDSPWGVSYLSQTQYWQDRTRPYDGYRGVISAILTRFNVRHRFEGENPGRTAWECTRDEIARRVWSQIEETWDIDRYGPLPVPRYFYLDDSIEFSGDDGPVRRNRSPYLVNHVGQWDLRGGRRVDDGDYVYDLQMGHTVFAGVFMRTHTRLTTMESANESARRAVNAILREEEEVYQIRHQRCETWNPEDHEVADLRPIRALDARLFRRGERHFMDSELAEVVVEATPWDLLRVGLGGRS